MKKRSLGFKLIFGGAVIVLIPVLAVGLFSLIKSSDALDQLARERAVLAANNMADTVELVFETEAKFMREMSSRASVRSTAMKVREAGLEGASQELSALNQDLSISLKEMGKDYELLIVVDTSGKVIADSMNGAQKGLDISGRPYFQIAKSGQTAISDPVISKASGKLVTPIAVPVKDDKGQVAAVMASVLKIDYLTDHIMKVRIGVNIHGIEVVKFTRASEGWAFAL